MASAPHLPTDPISSPNNGKTFDQKLFARIRVATESDVPHIYKLMQQLFAYHNITHLLKSTENSIASALFKPKFPHLSPVTALVINFIEPPLPLSADFDENLQGVLLGVKEIDLDNMPLIDEESEEFRDVKNQQDDVFIAGYVMFYPCFSSFFDNPVFHMEDLFIRECYRGKGFGKWMFSTIASKAARMGFSSIDWIASQWNKSAIQFYTQMGARISDDFRVLSLAGKALEAFNDDSDKGLCS
ncbi:tyramine N-feruloyltransferase 4/11-like [Nicotiana tomentosiformis]|uniref:tyramine N-feruloyltransferase 4/11-like n=1 Tax=Nicotiana tomentosiformis TaxID=4098 RepID=UPI00051AB4CC|nr:tyramine N-feruloyltransferase 4/11-like [Nicotiana tomentosiformis]